MITGVHPAGPTAWLIELDTLTDVVRLHAQVSAAPLPGQREVLPAARTLLVRCADRGGAVRAHQAIAELRLAEATDGTPVPTPDGKRVDIEVVYDGDDLTDVARLAGISTDSLIDLHTGSDWVGAFGGFAPGFTYCTGGDSRLAVPRRDSPRTSVPSGAVALAGEFSAVYPRASPGGWQLIGHTDARMWDTDRDEPALVRPGDRVHYSAVRGHVRATDRPGTPVESARDHPASGSAVPGDPASGDAVPGDRTPDRPASALVVDSPGLQSVIEDLGRPGRSELGVSPAGAVDPRAARQVNRLVGNSPDAAVIENVLGGLRLTARADQVVAISGAEPASVSAGRRPVAPGAPFVLLDSETLDIGRLTAGLRCYVGVRGGIDVRQSLGSRSTDSMSGIGPDPLTTGSLLPVGDASAGHVVGAPESSVLPAALHGDGPITLRITLGPRADWFTPTAVTTLCTSEWIVTNQSNRIGVRLAIPDDGTADDGAVDDDAADDGAAASHDSGPLERRRDGELPSEGVMPGSLQVPPSGMPVLFLTDHPVTGGYPVIAVVVPEDLPTAGQVPPGRRIRFTLEGATP